MRVNVYSQELTDEVELVSTTGEGINGPDTFWGVRFYLHSSDRLHHDAEDDDRSAVTFWLPRSKVWQDELRESFLKAAQRVLDAQALPR